MRTLGSILRGGVMPRLRVGDVDMTPAVQGIRLASPSTTRNKRIAECEHNSEKFAKTYFPRHFNKPFCEQHRYVFQRIDADAPAEGKREALIAPRKFGKTTQINLVLPIQALAYQRKRFVLLIGESSAAAEGNLATITQELETNELLLEDFPHLKPAMDPKGQYVKWTDRQLVLSNHATLVAKGMGSRMRGIKYRHQRPDLAVIDDPESPETADTFLKRRRHKRWFGGTFLGLGTSDWDIFVIGNLPHHDSLIAGLVLSKEWQGMMYRAINIPPRAEERYPIGNTRIDGTALWPEEWPLEALENYKRQPEVGSLGFAREMMNDPREEEDKPFVPLLFAKFTFTEGYIKDKFIMTATAVDPAGGTNPGEYKKGIRDYCAIVSAGRTRDGFVDVFDVQLTKAAPDQQIETLLDVYQKWKTKRIGVEEVMFKNLYAPNIRKAATQRALYPTIITLKQPRVNKQSRILGLQPLVMDTPQTVRFAEHLFTTVPHFFAQFDEFPATFDDGPDATEMVVRMLERSSSKRAPTGMGGTSHWKGKA
jgi:predicted phage terminase large subunit-like protein